jgi:ubiquinone/menaquinone biosynthesis C-methylase UbiE
MEDRLMLAEKEKKGYKGLPLTGILARWYAKNTGKHIEDYRKAAQGVADGLPAGSDVLEVAPGPGYFAIALAQLGSYHIVGLDISETFVEIATDNARRAGVDIEFRQGNASSMPFDSASFDFVYCRAAFKNFSEPVRAIDEMHRVLRSGGTAVIADLRKDATMPDIDAAVAEMGLGRFNAMLTRLIFKHSLLKRAYSEQDFRDMVSQTAFATCEINTDSIGMEIVLRK